MNGLIQAKNAGQVFGKVVRLPMAEIAADGGDLTVTRCISPRSKWLPGVWMDWRMRDWHSVPRSDSTPEHIRNDLRRRDAQFRQLEIHAEDLDPRLRADRATGGDAQAGRLPRHMPHAAARRSEGCEPAPGSQEIFGRLTEAGIETGAACPER